MRHVLLTYVVPVVAVVIGILGGVAPPSSIAAVWLISVLALLLAVAFVAYAFEWRRAGLYIAIVTMASFCAEYTLVNPAALLTHFTYPQLAGVSILALIQDALVIAVAYIFASAMFDFRGPLATAVAAATITLVTAIVAGPWGTTLGYYVYNQPFLSWGESLGLGEIPPVPWAEPLGLALLAFVTTLLFALFTSVDSRRRPFSVKWAALLYFSSQTLPGWSWAAYTEQWAFFVLGSVLLAGLAALALKAGFTADDGISPSPVEPGPFNE